MDCVITSGNQHQHSITPEKHQCKQIWQQQQDSKGISDDSYDLTCSGSTDVYTSIWWHVTCSRTLYRLLGFLVNPEQVWIAITSGWQRTIWNLCCFLPITFNLQVGTLTFLFSFFTWNGSVCEVKVKEHWWKKNYKTTWQALILHSFVDGFCAWLKHSVAHIFRWLSQTRRENPSHISLQNQKEEMRNDTLHKENKACY